MSKEKEQQLSLSTTAFEALEKDFAEVLTELAGDEHLEKFRIEYEQLHRTLLKSHENEKRLMKKCQELNNEIIQNASKVHTALKLSQDDQNTIFQLRKEIEKAWKMVEASHEKEAKAKETIAALTKEISVLSKLVDHGSGVSDTQEATVNELIKEKDQIQLEKNAMEQQIQTLYEELTRYQKMISSHDQAKVSMRNEIDTLKEKCLRIQMDFEREDKGRHTAEKALAETREVIEKNAKILEEKDMIIRNKDAQIKQCEKEIERENMESILLKKTIEDQKSKFEDLAQKLEKQIQENAQYDGIKKSLEHQIREVEKEKFQMGTELQQERRQNQQLMLLNEKLQKRIEDDKETKKGLKNRIVEVEEEVLNQKRKYEKLSSQVDSLKHEKNLITNKAVKAEKEVVQQKEKVYEVDSHRKTMQNSLFSYKKELEKNRDIMYKLEREKDHLSRQASKMTLKYNQSSEEAKIKSLENAQLQKKVDECQRRLTQQQALYEAVRSDRNMYSKSLIDANEKISEFKRKFQIMRQQMGQLNEEIDASDKSLAKSTHENKVLEEDKRKQVIKIQQLKKKIDQQQEKIVMYQNEVSKLNAIIEEADIVREQQRKELEKVVNYRDILGTQLIRRNDEIALLYEKIKIQQSNLSKGAVAYRQKQEDIRVLKLNVQEMKRKVHVLRKEIQSVIELKQKLASSERSLLLEKTKVKALSEELENPMNIHRWRKLEGSDPTAYEMILKTQTLQKRLIRANEKCMEKDLVIQEKKKLYEEVKEILKRQPGPEVAEQLNIYQNTLRKKNTEMKTMASELNTYMFQVKQKNYEAERLARELSESKKMFYQLKRTQKARPHTTSHGSRGYRVTRNPETRPFVGGGFKTTNM